MRAEFIRYVNREIPEKYGGIFKGWAGFKGIVGIATLELMLEPILTSQKLITKAHEYKYLADWLGNCMFVTTSKNGRIYFLVHHLRKII